MRVDAEQHLVRTAYYKYAFENEMLAAYLIELLLNRFPDKVSDLFKQFASLADMYPAEDALKKLTSFSGLKKEYDQLKWIVDNEPDDTLLAERIIYSKDPVDISTDHPDYKSPAYVND